MTPGRLELIVFLIYLVLGPLAWAFYGQMLIAGRRKMLLMKPTPIEGPPPSVTLLIPAKDEGERIRDCLKTALSQEYPNFDVIAIDDRSTDVTGAVMDEVAAQDPRLKVIHIKQPPPLGWTGKNNALATGVRAATGEWLLFVDSDVVLQPQALPVAMGVVLRKKFDLLSLLPRLESHTVWESLLVPLAASAASTMYLIALANTTESKTAFANGQFLFISRSAYNAFGGHDTVKDRYCEDVEIARQLKLRGLRPRISWGNDYSAVRMYSSLPAIFRGWSRIYYAAYNGSPWRILMALGFLLACCFTAYAALAWGLYRLARPAAAGGLGALFGHAPAAWLAAALLHLWLLTWYVARMYRWSGNPARNALLFPVGGSMVGLILLRGLRMCWTKKVEWRGTAYSHQMAANLTAATEAAAEGTTAAPGAEPQEANLG